MPRRHLFQALDEYVEFWGPRYRESPHIADRFRVLLSEFEDGFCRECLPGHITASALVVDPDHQRVLLTHHAKLDKWLQLGGHCDGIPNPHGAALREVQEESGLQGLKDISWRESWVTPIFDLDIHAIPARKNEPPHFHYDMRYLLEAVDPDSIQRSEESHALKWLTFDEARTQNSEVSLTRMFDKFEYVRASAKIILS